MEALSKNGKILSDLLVQGACVGTCCVLGAGDTTGTKRDSYCPGGEMRNKISKGLACCRRVRADEGVAGSWGLKLKWGDQRRPT